jgi:hypothetical protein
MYLDCLSPDEARVGYGNVGWHGHLGYEGKPVLAQGRPDPHALSTHPPARLVFPLAGGYSRFVCQVALNDDVSPGRSHADFAVRADRRLVAAAPHVVAGELPRPLSADVRGARALELVTDTSRWEFSHAVWLDPRLDDGPAPAPEAALADCLDRATIALPFPAPRGERCVATVVSPGFEPLLDDMLGSLLAHGCCPDVLLVVFAVDPDGGCARVAEKYGATLVRCTRRRPINVTVKSVLYSAARLIDAERFLCLDADMLVLGDLNPVFAALDLFPEGSILACREANHLGEMDLLSALQWTYRGNRRDLERLLPGANGEGAYSLIVNDGLFAGRRAALLALDGAIRRLPQAAAWVDEGRHFCWWRNQFIFNLALAQLRCGVALDDSWNVQLHTQDVAVARAGFGVEAWFRGRPVRVLHFCGLGRPKYPECRGLYARGTVT